MTTIPICIQFGGPRTFRAVLRKRISHCQCLGETSNNQKGAGTFRTVYGFQCNERYLEWDESASVSF
jgi:hypothetical protein